MKRALLGLIKFYRLLPGSAFGHCRFQPTCSVFAYEAIEKYGALKGSVLSIRRLLKCHPFSGRSGYDPVP